MYKWLGSWWGVNEILFFNFLWICKLFFRQGVKYFFSCLLTCGFSPWVYEYFGYLWYASVYQITGHSCELMSPLNVSTVSLDGTNVLKFKSCKKWTLNFPSLSHRLILRRYPLTIKMPNWKRFLETRKLGNAPDSGTRKCQPEEEYWIKWQTWRRILVARSEMRILKFSRLVAF